MPETKKLVAQSTLDELFRKGQLPFKLVAHRIQQHGDEYVVQFYDSRLHSVTINTKNGHDFIDLFRAAVLEGVKGIMLTRGANSNAS
jgi:hypothetical protein